MIALLVAAVLVAVLLGLAFAIGGVVLPILLVLAGLVVVGWIVLAGVSRRTPSEIAESTHEQELLGPGGPDDPRS